MFLQHLQTFWITVESTQISTVSTQWTNRARQDQPKTFLNSFRCLTCHSNLAFPCLKRTSLIRVLLIEIWWAWLKIRALATNSMAHKIITRKRILYRLTLHGTISRQIHLTLAFQMSLTQNQRRPLQKTLLPKRISYKQLISWWMVQTKITLQLNKTLLNCLHLHKK